MTDVPPVYVFEPVKVSTPLPILARPPAPLSTLEVGRAEAVVADAEGCNCPSPAGPRPGQPAQRGGGQRAEADVPAPLVSSVLYWRAAELATVSVPLFASVVPL